VTEALLVLVGGAAGALLRWGLSLLGPTPWSTLAANVTGSLLLGVVVATGPAWATTLLGAGVAGALTTWSTLALEAVTVPRRTALVYMATTLVAGGLGFALGRLLGGLT
jgi:fluoride exporter